MVMGECRGGGGDGLIKLFGKTIPVPEPGDAAAAAKDLQRSASSNSNSNSSSSTESDSPGTHTPLDASPQAEVVDAEDPNKAASPLEQPADDAAGQRERLRRPDKVLPCPRCTSMDTKFCYFNNYNVNQPRHFCKNCQRYWTAGGAMRNVPVGAGRRKNKNAAAASHFLHRVRAALPADALKATNGTVLSFAHAAPPPHALDLAQPHLKEKLLLVPARNRDKGPCGSEGSTNRDDKLSHSDGVREASTTDKPAGGAHPASMNGAAAWPYGCAAPSPAYFSSGIAIPIYPAAPGYWGCMVPGAWSLPWPPSQGLSSPTSTAPSVSSGPDSLTLGKHPREQGDEGRSGGHGKVWAPKTIRIDDADEVARSSIWSMIGIKGDKQDADGGRHKLDGTVFEPRCEAKTAKHAMISSSPLLHANPVALTRSVTFQEGS